MEASSISAGVIGSLPVWGSGGAATAGVAGAGVAAADSPAVATPDTLGGGGGMSRLDLGVEAPQVVAGVAGHSVVGACVVRCSSGSIRVLKGHGKIHGDGTVGDGENERPDAVVRPVWLAPQKTRTGHHARGGVLETV